MRARIGVSLSATFLALSAAAQSLPQAAQQLESTTHTAGSGQQVEVRNTASVPIDALVLRVYSFSIPEGKPLARGHHFLDRIASNGKEHPLQPGATWTSPTLALGDEKTSVVPVACGAVFADGQTSGDQECIEDILNRRRSILIGSRTAIAALDSAQREKLSRDELLERLKGLRAPLPWEVGKPVPGATNHPTLSMVREAIQAASEANTGLAIVRAREQLRARISLIESSKPALE